MRLPLSYFQNEDVVFLAKDLLGKELHCNLNNVHCAGLIVETEAYRGPEDRASHAYNNRRTARTETMFQEGGRSYIYLCYGIHHLFNIVTHRAGTPHAILIRALQPTLNLEEMRRRRGGRAADHQLCAGPGTLTQAMGLRREHDNISLDSELIWVEDKGLLVRGDEIAVGPRIGIDYAGEDAKLPWRFLINYPN
jgi:DNA-3-methyladenine glycosylase